MRAGVSCRPGPTTSRSAIRPSTPWQAGRRCLVVADGYYEWRDCDKQPFAIALANRGPMTLAGLWDYWRTPAGEIIKSFAIITTKANDILAPLHDRMPVVVPPDRWAEWLGEKAVAESALKTLLCPIQAAPWRFGRSIGGSAMLETIARTCSHRDRSAELGGRTIKNPPNAFQHLHDSRHNAGGVARFCDRLYRLEPINEALTGIARQRATKGKNPRHRVAGEHLCNYCSCWF